MSHEASQLLRLYVERFNERDWDGLRELIAADATLRVADRYAGRFAETGYLSNLMRLFPEVRLAIADVDGQTTLVSIARDGGTSTPLSILKVEIIDGRIATLADYVHCPWILQNAQQVAVLAS